VYLHCNTGSRLEGRVYLDEIIKKKMALCVFDFSGSGMSEGEYISLGYHELNDVESVISYLK